jgi:hypothetical protein
MTAGGDWDLVVTTPLGERRGVLSLKTDGKILLGRQTADGNSTEIFDGASRWYRAVVEDIHHRSDADDSQI